MMEWGTLLQAILSLIFVVGLILLTGRILRWWEKKHPNFLQVKMPERRLSVVETLPIDFRCKLVLVRRDDALHLLLCGDGRDIVIETQIPSTLPHENA